MRQVVSLWLPTFSTDRLQRRRPSAGSPEAPRMPEATRALVATRAPEAPLALYTRVGARLLVDAANAAAREAGVIPGRVLADARAIEPGLRVLPVDPDADRRRLDDLADWCGRFTPWAAPEAEIIQGAAGIWLDVTGCAHLFGGETALLAALLRRVRGLGFAARAALAETPGAAWALARHDARSADGLALVGGALRRTLLSLPVAGLRLGPGPVADLAQFGLTRIGQLTGMARAPLVARFGEQVARRLDQALGRVREPISPRRPVPVHRTTQSFAEPIGTLDDVAAALRRLLVRLCDGLEQAGQGARRVELALYRLDGTVRRLPVGTHRAVRDVDHLYRLLAQHLDKLDVSTGIETIALAAPVAETLAPVQAALSPALASSDRVGDRAGEALAAAPLIDRLVNRLGPASVTRPVPRASHLPECAELKLPLVGSTPPKPAAPPSGRAPRPIRLLRRPEPIDAVALLPDDPPGHFQWRGVRHQVARADGPERLAPEWWRADAPTRDYYRVEDESGRRFWVYRDGLYGVDAEPRWYLHGVFA